jgi:hypothetical protein
VRQRASARGSGTPRAGTLRRTNGRARSRPADREIDIGFAAGELGADRMSYTDLMRACEGSPKPR